MAEGTQPGERRFVRLTEINDHEGETWYWYLQQEGNSENLQVLADIIHNYSNEDEYVLDLENSLSESEVDTLVKHGNDTAMYQNQFNKVTGVMRKPEVDQLVKNYGIHVDLVGLYKGRVQSLFES
jgi:hypothetical protein